MSRLSAPPTLMKCNPPLPSHLPSQLDVLDHLLRGEWRLRLGLPAVAVAAAAMNAAVGAGQLAALQVSEAQLGGLLATLKWRGWQGRGGQGRGGEGRGGERKAGEGKAGEGKAGKGPCLSAYRWSGRRRAGVSY